MIVFFDEKNLNHPSCIFYSCYSYNQVAVKKKYNEYFERRFWHQPINIDNECFIYKP